MSAMELLIVGFLVGLLAEAFRALIASLGVAINRPAGQLAPFDPVYAAFVILAGGFSGMGAAFVSLVTGVPGNVNVLLASFFTGFVGADIIETLIGPTVLRFIGHKTVERDKQFGNVDAESYLLRRPSPGPAGAVTLHYRDILQKAITTFSDDPQHTTEASSIPKSVNYQKIGDFVDRNFGPVNHVNIDLRRLQTATYGQFTTKFGEIYGECGGKFEKP